MGDIGAAGGQLKANVRDPKGPARQWGVYQFEQYPETSTINMRFSGRHPKTIRREGMRERKLLGCQYEPSLKRGYFPGISRSIWRTGKGVGRGSPLETALLRGSSCQLQPCFVWYALACSDNQGFGVDKGRSFQIKDVLPATLPHSSRSLALLK